MPQTELLARLDQVIEKTEAFGPLFFELHNLKSEILQASAPAEAEAAIEDAFRAYQAQQEYKEACMWTGY